MVIIHLILGHFFLCIYCIVLYAISEKKKLHPNLMSSFLCLCDDDDDDAVCVGLYFASQYSSAVTFRRGSGVPAACQ